MLRPVTSGFGRDVQNRIDPVYFWPMMHAVLLCEFRDIFLLLYRLFLSHSISLLALTDRAPVSKQT